MVEFPLHGPCMHAIVVFPHILPLVFMSKEKEKNYDISTVTSVPALSILVRKGKQNARSLVIMKNMFIIHHSTVSTTCIFQNEGPTII